MRAIDGTHVKEWLTCPRLPFLAFHEPDADRAEPSERLRILMQSGRRIEAQILGKLGPEAPTYPPGDLAAGHAATLALMARRVPAIADGVLQVGDLVGRPDLLLWNPEARCYEVADIKSSQRISAAARMQVAFYSHLVARLDEPARRGWVIVRDGSRAEIDLGRLDASVAHLVGRLEALRSSPAADPGPLRIEACSDCRHGLRCVGELSATLDAGLLPDLTRAQLAALRAAGFDRLQSLTAIDSPTEAAARLGLPTELVRRLRAVAAAVLAGQPQPLRRPTRRAELAAAQFALTAIYDERQSEPAAALAGVVLGHPERFRARFLRACDTPDPVAEFRTLLQHLTRTRGPILVFGPAVDRALNAMVERSPDLGFEVDRGLRPRLVDVRAELRRTVALPGHDRTPALAARAAGIDIGDDAVDLEALRYLEGEPASDRDAIAALARRDLAALDALRALVLRFAEGQ